MKSQSIKWQCRIDIVDLKLTLSCLIDNSRQCRFDFDITLSFVDQSSSTFQLVVASSNNNTLSFDDSVDLSSATFKLVVVSITIENSTGSFKVSSGAFQLFNQAPAFTAELIDALTFEQSNHELGFVVHHEIIKLINGLIGHIELTELISRVLDGQMNYFQQGAASHFNDACIHRLIVVSVSEGARQVAPAQQAASSTILKLIDALISEGARFDSNLYQPGILDSSQLIVYIISAKRASKIIVIYSKIPLCFSNKYGIFCEGEWRQHNETNGSLARFEQLPVGVSAAPTFFNGKISSIFQLVVAFVANKYTHDGISRHHPQENELCLFDEKDIKLIVDSEGAQFASATLQVQARNHQTIFQRAASHFNDGRLLNYSIVGFQRVVDLIQVPNSEGERNVLKTTSRLIVDSIPSYEGALRQAASKLIVICAFDLNSSLLLRTSTRIPKYALSSEKNAAEHFVRENGSNSSDLRKWST